MEQLDSSNPWADCLSVDPERMGGAPVFRGTRVPVSALFEYLQGGHDLETFLDHFEGVTKVQAQRVLSLVADNILTELRVP